MFNLSYPNFLDNSDQMIPEVQVVLQQFSNKNDESEVDEEDELEKEFRNDPELRTLPRKFTTNLLVFMFMLMLFLEC